MYKTSYWDFDWDSWEDLCKKCLKKKYGSTRFQDMPADVSGDLWIEWFIIDEWVVFQCYCPDSNADNKTLYESQLRKITKDIRKLRSNSEELEKFIGNKCPINKWIFLTPEFTDKKLHQHARKKEGEVKKGGHPFIDDSFNIVIWDISDIEEEIKYIRKWLGSKDIFPNEIDNEKIVNWAKEEIDLIDNANRKNSILLNEKNNKTQQNTNSMTHCTVTDFFDYNGIMQKWSSEYQEEYEKFLLIVKNYEKWLTREALLSGWENNVMYQKILNDFKAILIKSFPNLWVPTIDTLTRWTIADWILRCPLNFTENENT